MKRLADFPIERITETEAAQLCELVNRGRPVHPHAVARLICHAKALQRRINELEAPPSPYPTHADGENLCRGDADP